MMKLLGTVMICGSCTVFGVSAWQQLCKRVHGIDAMLTALEYMIAELEYKRTPLLDMVQVLTKSNRWKVALLFRTLQSKLQQEDELSFSYKWCRALEECREDLGLQEEEVKLLQDVAAYLGRYDAGQQIRALQQAQRELRTLRKEAREEVKTRGKLYRSCGLAAGVVIALALL